VIETESMLGTPGTEYAELFNKSLLVWSSNKALSPIF